MQTIYTKLKVNNEIEICEVVDLSCKAQIERVLLQHRISYYIRWIHPKLFSKRRETCIFCVNDMQRDMAESLIRSLDDHIEEKVHFLMRKSENSFL